MLKIWTVEQEAAKLHERFDSLKNDLGIGQAEFARKFDVPGGASMVSQHIKGRRPINMEAAHRYATGFQCSLEEISPRLSTLAQGIAASVNAQVEASVEWANVEPRASFSGNVPLISWIRAGDFCESPDNFEPGDAEDYLPRPLHNMGKHVFALTVRGDSMDTPEGYREGEIVYIDPEKSPVSGHDVVARVDNKLNLKRYKEDQEGPYLLQLNGNIIIRPKGEWSVCGVVVFSGKRR